MKFFKLNIWFTVVELIISMSISVIIFLSVFYFVTNWLSDIEESNSKTKIVDQVFSFRNELNKLIRSWYINYSKVWNSQNSVLLLKNVENNRWILLWVVDKDTMKIQEDYVYWNNVIWYRLLSEQEVINIESTWSIVYSLNFYKDEIFDLIMVKDFNIELYNSEEIIDLYLSTFIYKNNSDFWRSLSWFYLNPGSLLEFNFNF